MMKDIEKQVKSIHKKSAQSGVCLGYILDFVGFPKTTYYSWLSGFAKNPLRDSKKYDLLDAIEEHLDRLLDSQNHLRERMG